MPLSVLNIIMLLSAAQGILLALLILQKHRQFFANRFLSLMMFLYSLILFSMILTDLGYNSKYPNTMLLPLGVPFLIVPLHYLYAKSLIRFANKMKTADWFHFIPFAIVESIIIIN